MKRLILVSTLAFVLAMTSTVFAQVQHNGRIVNYHLNGAIQGRGVCVQTEPRAPTAGGWFCLFKSNMLYQEMTALLRDAYVNERECAFVSNAVDAEGLAILAIVECF